MTSSSRTDESTGSMKKFAAVICLLSAACIKIQSPKHKHKHKQSPQYIYHQNGISEQKLWLKLIIFKNADNLFDTRKNVDSHFKKQP